MRARLVCLVKGHKWTRVMGPAYGRRQKPAERHTYVECWRCGRFGGDLG